MSDETEARLKALGLSLPDAPAPAANYVPHLQWNGLLMISGQLSATPEKSVKGKLGGDLAVEAGQDAAKLACLNLLAQARAALGSLDQIAQVLRVTGYVNSAPEFMDQPKVVNGASDLLAEILGERGKHTRAAVGVASLPFGVAVELDAMIAVKTQAG